jgi:hypothetical protein
VVGTVVAIIDRADLDEHATIRQIYHLHGQQMNEIDRRLQEKIFFL